VYEPSYCLLKESRESWEYVVSDEFIYALKPINVTFDSLFRIPKDYLQGNVWIEIHITFIGERDTHAIVIVENHDTNKFLGSQHEDIGGVEPHPVHRNSSMLVDIAQQIQSPQEMTDKACSIASTLRLKRFDNTDCICGYSVHVPIESPLEVFAEGEVKNGELGPLGIGDAQFRKGPRQLIQGGTETIENLTKRERDGIRGIFQVKPDSIESVFKIVFTTEGIGLVWTKSEVIQFGLKRLEMFIRPTSFQISVGQAGLLRS
jgi:hypothetical protein